MKHTLRETMIKEELVAFLVSRKGQNLSDRTIDFYKDMLFEFADFCVTREVVNVQQLDAGIIREFLIKLQETHNPGGIHCYYRCIKAFCNWYELETDAALPNPIRKIRAPKIDVTPIKGISITDVNALIVTCDKSFLGIRDKALMRSMLDTGARAAELCNLKISDVNLVNGYVFIKAGKGGKSRTVFLTETSRTDIVRYLRRRTSRELHEPLWVSCTDTALTPSGLSQMLRRRAAMAQLSEVPSPHDFRRAFALESLRRGCDLVRLMYLMGHTSTQVLQRYLAIQTDDLKEAYENMGSRW